jgi:1-acyl-sn-glycerol-3-phosphate acyltransferase
MPDIKPQVYKDPRPAEEFTRFHEWVRTHRPGWIYELVRVVVTPLLWFVYRGWSLDTNNVPKDGAFILAPNHFSNLDHFFAGVFIRRKIQFMAKSQLYGNPILDYIFRVGGVFPVRRGHHDEEAFITARAVVERGGCVGMYCEGGRSRSGRLGEPKPGVGRLALESGVPVVPLAIHGSAGVRGWKRLRFPKVTLQYGQPVTFPVNPSPSPEEALDASRQVFDRVKAMYVVLEAEGRKGAVRRIKEREFHGAAAREHVPS